MNELRTTLDMGKETYVALKCKQNDDRTLILTLLSNGVPWVPEVDSILELRGKRSDSTVTIQTTKDITIENNVVTIELSKEFTRVQGTVELELNIRKLTEITTFTFTLTIEPSVIQDGALVSTNTSSVLEELTNVLDWGNMHLNNAIDNVVNLTKKHGQYSVGLVSGTRVVLPTVAEGEYVDIDYMFYADSDLVLVFDDNIKWSNQPIIQAGRSYRFSFRYVDGTWFAEWIKLERYLKDYIYKAGDTCNVLTGGYSYQSARNANNRLSISIASGSVFPGYATATTISHIDITNYTKLYLDLDCTSYSSTITVHIGSTVVYTIMAITARKIVAIDVSSITGLNKITFQAIGYYSTPSTLNIYNAWLEKNEFVDPSQEIFTLSEKNKLTGISAGANKVLDSTINGNILIDNVETNVYTHPTGTNPHNTTKTDIGLSNVDNTTDLLKPISTATQIALDGKISTTQKGVANGVAQLNSNGVVPSSQLPSYVDDVLEYTSNSLFPTTGESGKIYINTTSNLTYRWTGSGYAEISPSIALGETSSTAYAGDKGKATTDNVNGHLADMVSHITSTERTNWNSASTNNHTHSNKNVLDNTTASYTTAEQTKLSGIANNANNYTLPVASAVIGGVKSGTDITVDTSGNVLVNDDSHNHIIANVDGLQTILDGKVDDGQVLTNVPLNAKFTDTVYVHPANHLPSIIIQDTNNRFVTDVEKSTWNGKATQTDINHSINAIQIGGRNLLLKSADMKTNGNTNWYTQSAIIGGADCEVVGTPSYSYRRCEGDLSDISIINLKSGQITLGMDFKTNKSDILQFHLSVRATTNTNIHDSNIIIIPNTNNEWKRFYVVMNMPTDEIVRNTIIYYISSTTNTAINDTFSYRNIKMEKGNKATDWTPAPEDVDSAIALKADKTTSGTTANRPIPTHIGQVHFDTTLGKPIWCKTVDIPVWVDGIGTTV